MKGKEMAYKLKKVDGAWAFVDENGLSAFKHMSPEAILNFVANHVWQFKVGSRDASGGTAFELPMRDVNQAAFEYIADYGKRYLHDRVGGSDTTLAEKINETQVCLGEMVAGTWEAGRVRQSKAGFASPEDHARYLTVMASLSKEDRETIDAMTKDERDSQINTIWDGESDGKPVKELLQPIYEEKLRRLLTPKAPKVALKLKKAA
jgi:hypothetical protein